MAGINLRRDQEVGPGNWTPILDAATWRLVGAKLGGDREVTTVKGCTYVISDRHRGRTPGRPYLLTGGLAMCGACGFELIGSEKQLRNKSQGVRSVPHLFCHPKTGGKPCVGIMAIPTEEFVVAEMFVEIKRRQDDERVDDGAIGARRDALNTGLGDVSEQRKDLARMWAAKQLNGVEWAEARWRHRVVGA